jgi:Flp pilus assembly protein TadD
LRRGLNLKGNLPRLHNNLLLAIAWQGDYVRAVAVRGSIPLSVALNNVGYVALLRNDNAAAAKLFQQALDASSSWYPRAAANLAAVQGSP